MLKEENASIARKPRPRRTAPSPRAKMLRLCAA
jgi:hypothetical protein